MDSADSEGEDAFALALPDALTLPFTLPFTTSLEASSFVGIARTALLLLDFDAGPLFTAFLNDFFDPLIRADATLLANRRGPVGGVTMRSQEIEQRREGSNDMTILVVYFGVF